MGFRDTPWSKTQYYRRLRRANDLGCDMYSIPDMRGRHGNQGAGSKCGKWKGGNVVSSHGYKKVLVGRAHPLSDPNGYAYEHLLVWMAAGNPRPEPGQVIHHINGDKRDNRIENMALLTNSEHLAAHARGEIGALKPGQDDSLPGVGTVKEWSV
jgi:hypothetical protein